LAIGIIVSMFSAIIVTRTFIRLIHRWTGRSTWLYGVRQRPTN
jgi:preprotein translocase subunit SecD